MNNKDFPNAVAAFAEANGLRPARDYMVMPDEKEKVGFKLIWTNDKTEQPTLGQLEKALESFETQEQKRDRRVKRVAEMLKAGDFEGVANELVV